MSYAIIGFGAIGQALAGAFARKNIEVVVASRRPPEALVTQAQAVGPSVIPTTLQEAIKADTIFLAVPFREHRQVAKLLANWQGKTVVDATNALDPDAVPWLSSRAASRGATFIKSVSNPSSEKTTRRFPCTSYPSGPG
jgi:predicted dinucleotide-binding enzyme